MERRLAIVMGRNYTSRLGMIRALGRIGCDVAVVQTYRISEKKTNPIDRYSKYINKGYFEVFEPDPEKLLQLLFDHFMDYEKPPILIPTDDYTASVIDLNIKRLESHFLFPNIGCEQGKVVYYMDKGIQKEIAKSVGLKVAEGWTSYWNNEQYSIPAGVEYPCFIKPEISYRGAGKYSMKKCNSEKELIEALSKFKGSTDYPILIEKYIEIEREYAVLGYSDKKTVVIPDIIEMKLGDHGVTAKGVITPIECFEGLQEKLCAFMRHIGLTGLFDIDLYENKGDVYFNELNLRFGASGFAITQRGINLPEMLINNLIGKSVNDYKTSFNRNTFINEKVMLQLLNKRIVSLKEYKKQKKEVDILFIEDKDDPQPYNALKKEEFITTVKYLLKCIIRKA